MAVPKKQVCDQLRTPADNVTLLTFAAVCHAAATPGLAPISIDIACPPGRQQQTRHSGMQRSVNGTDRWTDIVNQQQCYITARFRSQVHYQDVSGLIPTENPRFSNVLMHFVEISMHATNEKRLITKTWFTAQK